jgi:general secretion pathway protein A
LAKLGREVAPTIDNGFLKVQHESVYTDFFGLAELPFRITPDPRFLWYSPQHRDVKAKILHHIQTRKGPVYVFADVGTGKTSIKRVREELADDKTKKVVFAFSPNLKTTNAFLRFVMDDFDVKTDRNYARSLRSFENYLLDQYKAGVSPVLLVDEAQNMTLDMLRLIHHLFNFSTNTEFLIQVALFGQNELHDKIKRYSSLRSRMVPAKLNPLDPEETRQMIAFRWRVAGGQKFCFSSESVAEIFRLTGGNPRDICKLCDATLLRAFVDKRKDIDKDTVLAAASDAFVAEEVI